MMPNLVTVDLAKAIRNVLRGEHTFTDTIRNDAVNEVRNICGDRINSGRRPQGVDLAYVNLRIAGEDPVYNTSTGRSDRSTWFLQVVVYSQDAAERTRLRSAVVAAIDAMSEDVATSEGTIQIGSCYQDTGADDDARIQDGSDDYEFQYDLTFRIQYR